MSDRNPNDGPMKQETHYPEFMKDWSPMQKRAAVVGAVILTATAGVAANVLAGAIDKPRKNIPAQVHTAPLPVPESPRKP